ncbi:MAG: hypothetical protein ACE1Y4_12720 [Lysobacterales bacterium]
MYDVVFIQVFVIQIIINCVEQLATINAAAVAIDKVAVGIERKRTAAQVSNRRGTIADDEEAKLITGSHGIKSD